jgi:Ca2+-binding RTX toxin-like protein
MATLIGTGADDNLTGVWDELNIILGNGGKDTLTGGALSDSIDGGNAKDTIFGGVGDDLLIGGFDGDSLSGGSGADEIRDGGGSDTVDGGSGDDLIDTTGGVKDEINVIAAGTGDDVILGGKSDDLINGGVGLDTVSYAASSKGVTVNFWNGAGSGGDAKNDTYSLVENAVGSAFVDTFIGNTSANIFEGGDSSDTFKGRGGNDTLVGGAGNDVIMGGAGGDQMDGGGGIDTLSYEDSNTSVSIDLATDSFTTGDAEGDSISSIEIIKLGFGSGSLFGDGEDNTFIGAQNGDNLHGRGGDDVIDGKGQGDQIYGGAGDDTLTGGAADEPFAAQDNFFWDALNEGDADAPATDVITDFQNDVDKLFFSNFTVTPDFSNWTEGVADWGGDVDPDGDADDLIVTTDVGITIVLLNMSAANFDINDTVGVNA